MYFVEQYPIKGDGGRGKCNIMRIFTLIEKSEQSSDEGGIKTSKQRAYYGLLDLFKYNGRLKSTIFYLVFLG